MSILQPHMYLHLTTVCISSQHHLAITRVSLTIHTMVRTPEIIICHGNVTAVWHPFHDLMNAILRIDQDKGHIYFFRVVRVTDYFYYGPRRDDVDAQSDSKERKKDNKRLEVWMVVYTRTGDFVRTVNVDMIKRGWAWPDKDEKGPNQLPQVLEEEV